MSDDGCPRNPSEKRKRAQGRRTTFTLPGSSATPLHSIRISEARLEPQMEITEELCEGQDDVNLVYNRRRHSTIHRSEAPALGLLPSSPKPTGRRFSLMPSAEAARRFSVGITDAQRETLHLPRFSKVFGFTTFSGLPLMDYQDPDIVHENTYKMKPDNRFEIHKVKKVMEKVVDDLLYWDDDVLIDEGPKPKGMSERQKYETQKHKRRRELIKKIVDEVKDEIKELNFSRYKYVVNAMVGEVKGQGMQVASRCLWNTDTDTSVSIQRKGRDGYVVVIVHAVYFE